MTCGCEATISEKDPRAEIWFYVFGKRSFPLKHPLPMDMGPTVGLGYAGDATALTPEQRKRLIEKMTQKFGVKTEDITRILDQGVVPIRAETVVVSWCRKHSLAVL